jgi:uncharacterized protein (TIGR03382 family)
MHASLRTVSRLLALVLVAVAIRPTRADWNENVPDFGDMSDVPSSPSTIEFVHPTRVLTATTGAGDVDVITIEYGPFHKINSIVLDEYSGLTQSFIGVQRGTTWTAGVGAAIDYTKLLGWTNFGPTATGAGVGQNILDDMGVSKQGSQGFTLPLETGFYTFLLQDLSGSVNYAMEFNATYNSKLFGDFNGDLRVNRLDYKFWEAEYQNTLGFSPRADATGDGFSNGSDILVWQRYVGMSEFDATPIPEPASAALPLAALGAHSQLRRRRNAPA